MHQRTDYIYKSSPGTHPRGQTTKDIKAFLIPLEHKHQEKDYKRANKSSPGARFSTPGDRLHKNSRTSLPLGLPYSGKFSREQIFANHQQTRQEKNFAIFIFATRSRYPTTPPTIFLTQMVTLSMNFNVKTIVRRQHAYQSVSVAVGKELPCQREGANSEDLFAVAVMTGELS